MNLYPTVSSQKVGGRDLKLASHILLLKTTLKEVGESEQMWFFFFFLCSSLVEGGGRCFPSQDGSSNCALGYSNSITIAFLAKSTFFYYNQTAEPEGM